jgi:electron transfer flavoprotein alpha/beta subunit
MPETKLTVILPDEDGQIEQTGTIIAQRGELAAIHRFTFAAGQGMVRLAHVLPDVSAKLAALEASPPPVAATEGADEKRIPAAPKKSAAKKKSPAKTTARKASSKATKAAAEDDETPDWMKPFGSGVKPVKQSTVKKAN